MKKANSGQYDTSHTVVKFSIFDIISLNHSKRIAFFQNFQVKFFLVPKKLSKTPELNLKMYMKLVQMQPSIAVLIKR